jgi:O-antigen biosynthesis protein
MSAIEFTGERFIPGQGGAQIAYEHLHRYLFALPWAQGHNVLDMAAGSGYGTALLARCAGKACGIELDQTAVGAAIRRYAAPHIDFLRGDATLLPFRTGTFGLVTAFEVLEHVPRPEDLVREAARVCGPRGVALVSTPNKAIYSDARQYSNPFHVREFYREEFLTLLCASFRNVVLFHQHVRAGSLIAAEGGGDGWTVLSEPPPADTPRLVAEPMYFIALCSNGSLAFSRGSAYLDPTDWLLSEWEAETVRLNRLLDELGDWGKTLEAEVGKRDETLRRTLAEIGERDGTIEALQREIKRELGARDESIRQLQREFDERTQWAAALEKDVSDRDALLRQTTDLLERTDADLKRTESHMARIRRAFFYRVLCRLGLLPK